MCPALGKVLQACPTPCSPWADYVFLSQRRKLRLRGVNSLLGRGGAESLYAQAHIPIASPWGLRWSQLPCIVPTQVAQEVSSCCCKAQDWSRTLALSEKYLLLEPSFFPRGRGYLHKDGNEAGQRGQ